MEIKKRWAVEIVDNRKNVSKQIYNVFGIENVLHGGLKVIESHVSIGGSLLTTLEVKLIKTQECTC